MKVCMLAYTFYESDNRVRRYAETLVRRGDQVEAIVLRRDGQPAFEDIAGVKVFRVQKRVRNERNAASYLIKLLLFLVRSAVAVTMSHFRRRYDLIHVHSVPDFEVFATLIPKLMGTKVMLDIHDIVPEFYGSKFKVSERSLVFRLLVLMERLSTAYCDHVIIANHIWHSKLVARSTRAEKCTPIINYPDPAIFFARSRTRQSGDFVICYPGTLNSHQGVDRAIMAVASLRDKLPNLKFLVVGDGPDLEKLKAMVVELGVSDRVSITGSVPIEQVAETMANVDLGVVPKRADSFGNEAFSTKIMEFMAMGVPVLASATSVDRYYFNPKIVEFFDSSSVDDLAGKIQYLALNSVRRESLRVNALEFVGTYNWRVKGGEYLDLVDRLVKPITATVGARPTRHEAGF